MKKHMEIVQDEEEIAIYVIPLATKPPMIVEYKIVKEGQKGFYHLIRADGEKHGINKPVDEYERVLWGDLKVIFEPDIKSDVWRNLQGYKVTVWKLFDNYGVHFVRFRNLQIFMLVEKRYLETDIQKRTKNKAKNDKTGYGMEKCVKKKPNQSQKVNQVKKSTGKSNSQSQKE
ncbi:hypothetical protein Tco_0148643, partial [Tanacetum coccineum]